MVLMCRKNRLREFREAKNLSGYDLQALSNITASVIYLIERGLKRPALYEQNRLSDAIAESVEDVFPEDMARNREVVET
jgi:putative transcriptional regulator